MLATLRSPRPRDNTLPGEAARLAVPGCPSPEGKDSPPHREPLDTNSTGVALTASDPGLILPAGNDSPVLGGGCCFLKVY